MLICSFKNIAASIEQQIGLRLKIIMLLDKGIIEIENIMHRLLLRPKKILQKNRNNTVFAYLKIFMFIPLLIPIRKFRGQLNNPINKVRSYGVI